MEFRRTTAALHLSFPSSKNSTEMTIESSLGTPATGRGGAMDARNQENSECVGAQDSEARMVNLAPPPPPRIQEPVKLKRRRAYSGKVIWLSKKLRPAAVAESGLRRQVNWVAAPSSPIVREQDGNKGVDRKEEEKDRPCEFAATAYSLDALPLQIVQKPLRRDHHQDVDEECWLIKKSCHSAMVAAYCSGTNGAVCPVNSAAPSSIPSPRIQEKKTVTVRRRERINTKPSDCKAYVSLTSGLRFLGVTDGVTPVLAKILTRTDSSLSQARLQISPLEFMRSPLLTMLTPDEYASVLTESGLPMEAIDRHGWSYDMRLGFVRLSTGITYRLKKGWTRFLARSGVREGDLVQVGAFRVHGRLILTLLNYALDGSVVPEEMEAADGLLMLSDFKSEQP
ncbi:hypothetical protein QOZ80_5AG0361250 [Eleusine coracana subsp. coracana]|nr:hypothetical protein QOZ80_5AG0361250 [Eleusine coracana subsp. coracana]